MKTLSLFALLFISQSVLAQQELTYSYATETDNISNPERGFYHHTQVTSGNYNPLNFNTLLGYRENESISQILRVIYLKDSVNKPVSKEFLDNLHADFNTVRAAGIKVIVRFAYTTRTSVPYGDATPLIVKNHIFQLKEVLASHADVIATIQTGFVGAWGEWYYTDHFAEGPPAIISEENWIDRGNVVKDLLRVLPKDRTVQLRTPKQKMTIFETEEAITSVEAFSGEEISRVGHHNDCFVSSSTDQGTYSNQEIEKPYLEAETAFLPMGGETCALSPPYSDCENAYSELNRFHWSYLNVDYNTSVLDVWETQDCYDDVVLNLGYRYVLEDATLETEVHPEGMFDLSINLQNYGFANPYNPRDLEIILKSTTNGQVYKLTTDEEIRMWPIQTDFNLIIHAGFPAGIADDTYNVYLNLPDKSPSIQSNPAYSIRFFNQDIWEAETGWNDLGFQLVINSSFPIVPYTGVSNFYKFPLNEIVEPGPTSIFSGTNEGTCLLFWGRSEQYNSRRIDRSIDGLTFEPIAYVPAINDYYKIVEHNGDYYYRFTLMGPSGTRSYSDAIFVAANNTTNSNYQITTDGLDEDWKDVLPVASATNEAQESYALRTHFSLEKTHFSMYGPIENYKIFLNTDNLKITGTTESPLLEGMDYLLQDSVLYKFENDQWVLASSTTTTNSATVHEVEFAHSLLENIDGNYLIPMVAYFNNDQVLLSENDNNPAMHVRNIQPVVPANFSVSNSTSFPEERLELHWDICTYCQGYIIEKSDNGTDFSFLVDVDPEDEVYYHDFLPNGTHFYRIQSYNSLGASQFSEIKSGVLGMVGSSVSTQADEIKLWPNPTNDKIYITDKVYDSVIIRNADGVVVAVHDFASNSMDFSQLAKGVYLLTVWENGSARSTKVVKY